MIKKLFVLCLTGLMVSAFRFTDSILMEVPEYWPAPQYNFSNNILTTEKVELGRMLFYDPILSANNQISCASCHSPYNAFAHVDHNLSHGINDRIGLRNAPPLMNLAWQKSFMMDGAVNHLDMQSLFPITHPDEMGESIVNVIAKLKNSGYYPELFLTAFADSVITGEYMLKALSQFMLTLISAESKYDSVMKKQALFTEQERKGYALFRQNCASCHAEPLFTNGNFENNGLPLDTTLNDFGRMRVTQDSNDSLKFKVPTLRNIEFTFPYMHDGRFRKLQDVLNHYNHGVQHSATLSDKLQQPLSLNSNDKVDLTAFLLTLSDKNFLFNTNHTFPAALIKLKSRTIQQDAITN